MVGITQCSKILIRILPFCNTRLQQQTVAWITHGNLSDQFFCLDAMYENEYFMVVKGYVLTVPDSETKRHRNWTVQCEQAASAPLCCKIGIKIESKVVLLRIRSRSCSESSVTVLVWIEALPGTVSATPVQYPKSGQVTRGLCMKTLLWLILYFWETGRKLRP